ncbi:phosphatidylinositol 3- and 4-kinase family protein, putative [Ichthyophthirius multifiliis]|uniref:Phosphatidylinositol 3-and 4-kinase family protein, putative n=1 Tax=Ichthyophthirius multifiliis TaxID=5932 RepID=G0R6G7_ICHMU|nr:phosphatidylinositol 3- and 4-kinase family protein, putative [Ichthyophthirius multifiliis]EGR26934.1 phosphatidylinositol 3- and 4-kinase family protein, putative [Ichthyophthirius multifiliis]|eukprot:XP_004023818.1 phosphatidylinositol 3- and 4-kinase family protein, putative [Ichthyophthirius multifiliis]
MIENITNQLQNIQNQKYIILKDLSSVDTLIKIKIYKQITIKQIKQTIQQYTGANLNSIKLIYKQTILSNNNQSINLDQLKQQEQYFYYIIKPKKQKIIGKIQSYNFRDKIQREINYAITEIRKGLNQNINPKITDSGISGSYFIENQRRKKIAIFKPFDEEPYTPNNPKGYVGQLGQEGIRKGIRSGEQCFREIAAYLLDYDNFHNVPPTIFTLGISLISGLYLQNKNQDTIYMQAKKGIQKTKTFIWGNGIYQPRPEATLQFKNFEPKLIEDFQGQKNGINLQEIIFTEKNEFGIDINGQIYVWPTQKLDANFSGDPKDNRREKIQQITTQKEDTFTQICTTQSYLWALNQKGEVYQWNIQQQKEGQQQIPIVDIKSKKKLTSLSEKIKQISSGEDHLLFLTQAGDIYTLGDDTYGQCGLGASNRVPCPPFKERRVKNPRKVNALDAKVVKVACGKNHSLAVTQEGNLYGWGLNQNMQLSQELEFSKGEEPLVCLYEPLQIKKNLEFSKIVDVAAGEAHTMIVSVNRQNEETEVFGCGYNNKGELGVGLLRHICDVEKVDGLSNFKIQDKDGQYKNVRIKKIVCGDRHCLALIDELGVVMEWGDNENGQLGNKKRAFTEFPVIQQKFKNEKVLNVCAGENSSAVICEDSK